MKRWLKLYHDFMGWIEEVVSLSQGRQWRIEFRQDSTECWYGDGGQIKEGADNIQGDMRRICCICRVAAKVNSNTI